MSLSDQTLQAEILLGDDADNFFHSDLGRYVIGRAQQEVDEAMAKLKAVDPDNASQIRALQHIIRVAESVPLWFNEVLVSGRQALEVMQEDTNALD